MTTEGLDELPPDEALAKLIEEWGGEPPMADTTWMFSDLDESEPMRPRARKLVRTAIVPKTRALMAKLQAIAMNTGSVAPDNDALALEELMVWHKPSGFKSIGLPQFNREFAIYARERSPPFVDSAAFPTCFPCTGTASNPTAAMSTGNGPKRNLRGIYANVYQRKLVGYSDEQREEKTSMAESTIEKNAITECFCPPCPSDRSHRVCEHWEKWSYGEHTPHATDPNGPDYATTPMNRQRAASALLAIQAYEHETKVDREDAIADLLAELMHYAAQNGLNFDRELARGRSDFDEEKTGEEGMWFRLRLPQSAP